MAAPYKIGEAAALLNLKSYVLRFWETEFPDIVPLRTEKGQRLYTTEHLALLQRIRYLLHDRGLTIGGARKVLAEEKQRGVVYSFLEPGAAPLPVAEGSPPPVDLSFPPVREVDEPEEPDDAPEPDDDDPEPDEDAPDRNGFLPAKRGGADARPFSQYNLPGLEELIALRASVLDSGAGEEYSPVEETPAPPLSGGQGMLPLFAVARAAYFAGKASGGKAEGGGNFIHAGAVAAPRGGKEQEEKPAGAFSAAFIRRLAADLESVAALLRSGGSSEE